MRKLLFISLIILRSTLTLIAQWTGTTTLSNVGIGTNQPLAKLTVFDSNNKGLELTPYWQAGNGVVFEAINRTSFGQMDLNFFIQNNLSHIKFYSAATERMRITNDGKVGIGISTPEAKLQIDGGGGIPDNNYSNLTARSNFMLSSSSASTGGLGTATKLLGGIGSPDYVWLQAYNYSNSVGAAKNIVLNSVGGNVGIGTNCPKYTLDVLGVIRAQEVKVDLQGGCDFVFKSDYKLMDLKELENFVMTNQHLPQIATEHEMVENGVNMKDLQMKLLQKMEEMTLYMINQNKEIESLKQEITELKKK